MTPKESLLARLPKKYHHIVADFTEEIDLIDDCKYLLHWTDEYTDYGEDGIGSAWPVRSIAEAIDYIKTALYRV